VSPQAHLNRVENLLDEALQDLRYPDREAPATRCAAALAEAAAELQAFARAHREISPQNSVLRRQLNSLPKRLRRMERLLASAAEFYSGWCAARPTADYHASGDSGQSYQTAGWSNDLAPALLAFRG
jgi:hypothetical protein